MGGFGTLGLDRWKNWRGALPIVGGMLINVTQGSLYSYGNMVPYIVSYCRLRGNTPHLSYQSASYIMALMEVGIGTSMWVGGWLERKVGVRWATFIGSSVFCASVLLSAWTISVSFYFLLLTYGLLFGFGSGTAYVPILVCVMKWHPNSKGVACGCVLAGFGAGAFIFNFIQTGFINPDNLQPTLKIGNDDTQQMIYDQESILDRVPMSFVVQAIIFAIVQLIGIAMMHDPPDLSTPSCGHALRKKHETYDEASSILMREQTPSRTRGTSTADRCNDAIDVDDRPSLQRSFCASASASSDIVEVDDQGADITNGRATPVTTPGDGHDKRWSGRTVSPSQLPKEVFFWQLNAMVFLNNVAMVYIASLYKAFGVTFIGDDLFLTTVGSFASVSNAVGRLCGGIIVDKISFKVSFMMITTGMAASTFTFPLNVYGSKPMFFIWVCAMFFVLGSVCPTVPIATARAFGSEFVGLNYGVIYIIGFSLSAVIAALIQQVLFTHVSWSALFVIIGGFPTISLILCMFINVKTPDGDDV